MLIYGTKRVDLLSERSKETTCPYCQNQTTMRITVHRKHVHIFWIPMFPLVKKTKIVCELCESNLKEKDIPLLLQHKYANIKQETKGPIWQFVGLFLVTILIGSALYTSGAYEEKELAYLAAPQQGDVYRYKVAKGVYSSLKVMNVSADSVFVAPNEYEINKRSKIHRIDKAENYAEFSYGIAKTKINEMYQANEIFYISRRSNSNAIE